MKSVHMDVNQPQTLTFFEESSLFTGLKAKIILKPAILFSYILPRYVWGDA